MQKLHSFAWRFSFDRLQNNSQCPTKEFSQKSIVPGHWSKKFRVAIFYLQLSIVESIDEKPDSKSLENQ